MRRFGWLAITSTVLVGGAMGIMQTTVFARDNSPTSDGGCRGDQIDLGVDGDGVQWCGECSEDATPVVSPDFAAGWGCVCDTGYTPNSDGITCSPGGGTGPSGGGGGGGGGDGGGGGGGPIPPLPTDPPECQQSLIMTGYGSLLSEGTVKKARFAPFSMDEARTLTELLEASRDALSALHKAGGKGSKTPPKPACKETCRSCFKDADAREKKIPNREKQCIQSYTKRAEDHCRNGAWRNDPRKGDNCGIFESLSQWCEQNPGDPVDDVYCEKEYVNPKTGEYEQQCYETEWFKKCRQSWMNDIPATEITDPGIGGSVGINIGILDVKVEGSTDTVKVNLTGGQGYLFACAAFADKLQEKSNALMEACWERVEKANPGVTCE